MKSRYQSIVDQINIHFNNRIMYIIKCIVVRPIALGILLSFIFGIAITGSGNASPKLSGRSLSGIVSNNLSLDQKPDTAIKKDRVFALVEEMPKFPGGDEAWSKYISTALKYPPEAKKKGIQGPVYIMFVIEKDGSVSEAKVLKGIGSDCDEEALRVVKESPKWEPGKHNGSPVRVQLHLPVKFTLDNKTPVNKP
jgi:TonB family protein